MKYAQLWYVCRWLLFGAIGLLVLPQQSRAETNWQQQAEQALAGWQGQPQAERVLRVYRSHGVAIVASPHWGAREIQALERGLDALPDALKEVVPAPVFLRRRQRVCSFAQGRYDDDCPSFGPHRRTFYVYGTKRLGHQLTNRVMKGLDAAERTELQYRRAAVHLMVSLADRKLKWSEEPDWQQINGWSGGKALNRDWWGYSRPIGRRSAHLDLVTFAEEYFARPEDILRDSQRPEAEGRLRDFRADDGITCRNMTRARFLRAQHVRLAPQWEPPEPVNHADLSESWNASQSGCPGFEEWLDLDHLEGLEIFYATATADQAQSMFGHLLMHARYNSRATSYGKGFSPVFQFGAVTNDRMSSVEYLTDGMFGGFVAALGRASLQSVDKLFRRYEERNLRRYELTIGRVETVQVMQRVWEAQRHLRYDYYFLTQNCASFIIDLFRPALNVELPDPVWGPVLPSDILDTLASVHNEQNEPLLQRQFPTRASNRFDALRSVSRRRALVESLPGLADHQSAAITRLVDVHQRLEGADTIQRRAAYEELGEWIGSLDDDAPTEDQTRQQLVQLLVDYLHASVIIERYFMERSRFALKDEVVAATPSSDERSAREKLDVFRRITQMDSLEDRIAARNELVEQRHAVLKRNTVAVSTEQHEAKIGEETARKTYWAALEVLSVAIDHFNGDWDGVGYTREIRQEYRQAESEQMQLAMGPSGNRRLSLGLQGPLHMGVGGHRPGNLVIDASFGLIRDELGDVSMRGFGPSLEVRALDLTLRSPLAGRWWAGMSADLLLLRYYSLTQGEGPLHKDWHDGFGWGMDTRLYHDGSRGIYVGGGASAGLLYPFAISASGADLLVGGLFGAARAGIAQAGSGEFIGLRAFIRGQLHLYGSYANVARMEVESFQFLGVPLGNRRYSVSAELSSRHALGGVKTALVWLVPQLTWESTSLVFVSDIERVDDLKASLRLEFSLP